jgi:hypothetical protein
MPARVKEEPMSREVETEEEIRLELYRALIAAVDHLEGEARLSTPIDGPRRPPGSQISKEINS